MAYYNGYLWKIDYKNEYDESKSDYFFSKTSYITSATPLTRIEYGYPDSPSTCDSSLDIHFICGATATVEVINRVDYNHGNIGNKIVITVDETKVTSIASYTTDFVPGSEGAAYIFNTPNGQETYIVGSTYESITFGGVWGVNNDLSITPKAAGRCGQSIIGEPGEYSIDNPFC